MQDLSVAGSRWFSLDEQRLGLVGSRVVGARRRSRWISVFGGGGEVTVVCGGGEVKTIVRGGEGFELQTHNRIADTRETP
ncbi:unnamed protein product [Ilex paraguariensis]|uniref:Uncharacterized protein n=1 Tax=Ilex paraguariensis TaxID=185542 RepID=A0ABC8RFW6_9AQUA